MSDNDTIDYELWHYTPSLAGGIIASIAFALLTIAHTWRLARTRLWFCIPFVIGGLFETIGYAARATAHASTASLAPYIIQSVLILLAPILFAASIYMILARLIRACSGGGHGDGGGGGEAYSLVRVTWLTKIFVGGDVFCFLVQGAGASMLARAENQAAYDRGEKIVLGGLVLQIVVFGVFVVVAGVWHWRMKKGKNGVVVVAAGDDGGKWAWQRFMWVLYGVSGLVAVRNVARCVEYGTGRNSFLISHEWCLYVYDFMLMFAALAASLYWYALPMGQQRNQLPGGRDAEMTPY
ncbi:uncharacterized protein HMPREF1541_06048 [Cyphellophora europaea CBS 101466]|uniref:RTA1 domain protein n=1 Tax=Cyphellophora europaea (strain CBS 101466) TaxID=1220924 RepID=W2RTQ2_CYPE1|nr:uncharacterized protein HMPREF1541_06048 [Cyphellophora europaea CBS 101466]ETN39822.1 hypothetical protein HMPREF1541_06048 [Cyphellophora europaea CBS 101466]